MTENLCRVFLGIPVPQYIYEKLKNALISCEKNLGDGHWIPPSNAHITIRFFGDIDGGKLALLWSEIKNKIHAFYGFVKTQPL